MKTTNALIRGTVALFIALGVNHASAADEYFGVNLSASLSTQAVSGGVPYPAYSLHTTHINNHTITQALFATGTTGAVKESNLILVANGTADIYVINTSSTNDAVVATIAETGTNESATSVATGKGSTPVYKLVNTISDYEFTVPTVTGTQVTNVRESYTLNLAADKIQNLFISFSGGQGSDSAGATLFQGTIKQTAKAYP